MDDPHVLDRPIALIRLQLRDGEHVLEARDDAAEADVLAGQMRCRSDGDEAVTSVAFEKRVAHNCEPVVSAADRRWIDAPFVFGPRLAITSRPFSSTGRESNSSSNGPP